MNLKSFTGRSAMKNYRFIKISELAELLQVSPKTIYRHIQRIPHLRIGNNIRFDMESPELQAWLKTDTKGNHDYRSYQQP
jgi:excisionase family DNA binding protein